MDDAEHAIAVLDGIDEDAHGREVVDFADVLVVALHLLIDGIKVLRAAGNLSFDLRLFEFFANLHDGVVDKGLALLALLLDALDEVIVFLGLEVAQAEVFEFPFDVRNAEAVRERRVDLDGLFRDALLLLAWHVFERPHVVQAVGQLDHDDADVLRHREEHLAVRLELLLLARLVLDARELCHAVDEFRDFLAEHLLELLRRVDRVLDDIMQQRRCDRDVVDMELRENLGDVERMDDVLLARHALLPLVRR